MSLDPSNLLAAGGIAAVIAAGWRYVKMVWDFLSSFVVGHMAINDTDVEMVVFNHLWKNFRRISLSGSRAVGSTNEPIRLTGRHEMVACEGSLVRRWVFFIKGRPLFWNKDVRRSDGAIRQGGLGWIRGTIDVDALIRNAMIEYHQRFDVRNRGKGQERFAVHFLHGNSAGGMGHAISMMMDRDGSSGSNKVSTSPSSDPAPSGSASGFAHAAHSGTIHQIWMETTHFFNHQLSDFGRTQDVKSIETMALGEEAMSIVNECDLWLKSEEWFRKRSVPWRCGLLLYGPPGTGKTSLLRAIAESLDLPIFVMDIGTMNNQEFQKKWMEAVRSAPCMVAIEDVDGVFHGRDNVMGEKGGGLSFDAFLNTIDGLDRCNGVILAVTTNCIDRVDPALGRPMGDGTDVSTRPGRIDRVVCLKNPDASLSLIHI